MPRIQVSTARKGSNIEKKFKKLNVYSSPPRHCSLSLKHFEPHKNRKRNNFGNKKLIGNQQGTPWAKSRALHYNPNNFK
jgi:hypothetical protein